MWRDRNIVLVLIARFVSRVGGTAAFFVGVWGVAAYEFDATPSQLALMSVGTGVASIIGSATAGVLIDRFGPRRVLIVAEMLSIPAVLALGTAEEFALFALFASLFALVGIPTFTAGESFPPYLSKGREELEHVNGALEGAGSLGFVLGPAIGAAIARTWGPSAVFWFTAGACLIAIVAALFIRIDESPRAHSSEGMLGGLTEGMRIAYSSRSLRFYLLLGSIVWFGFGFFAALEPLFYRDAVKVGVEWIGWMNTLFGVGLVVGASLLPRASKWVLSATGITALTIAIGLSTLGYVGTTSLAVIGVGGLVWGGFIGLFGPALRTLMQLDAPPEYLGRIMGTAQYHRNAGELIPLAFAPALAAAFGVQAVLMGAGVLVAVLATVALLPARRLDAELTSERVVPAGIAGPADELEAVRVAIASEPAHAVGDRVG